MREDLGCEIGNCNNRNCFVKEYCYPEWYYLINMEKTSFEIREGERVLEEGQPVSGIYFIYRGKVKVHKKWGGDKEYIVRLAKSGEVLGHRGYGGKLFYPISATALEDSVLCFFDNNFFFKLLKTNHEFTYRLLMFYAEELRRAEIRMRNLAHMSVKGRIADSLLMIKDAYGLDETGEFLNLKLTRKNLANIAGTTYETVIRTLHKFSEEDAIKVNGKKIGVLNEPALRQLCKFEEAYI